MKIENLNTLSKAKYYRITARCRQDIYAQMRGVAASVIEDIRKNGDGALIKYVRKYDKVTLRPGNLVVSKQEIRQAYKALDGSKALLAAIRRMRENVRLFCRKEYEKINKGWKYEFKKGYFAGQVLRPLDTVGIYVPGGRGAFYPSSAVMGIVPAKIAGVREIIVATPPGRNGEISDIVLVAADLAGADVIIKAGGIQAIGAMAVGTETVPRVDKIAGPGNVYVCAAKLYVQARNYASIDFVAGPSELLVIADDTAEPGYIASDMIAQAEHGKDSSAVLVTTSLRVAERVSEEIEKRAESSERKIFIEKSLKDYGAILVAKNIKEAIGFANEFAPEHLELMTKKPEGLLKHIKNAGSIFLGAYTPVAAGDYISGTNHILPTSGSARFSCGVNVETFLKKPTFQKFSKDALGRVKGAVVRLSDAENLPAHGRSIEERFG